MLCIKEISVFQTMMLQFSSVSSTTLTMPHDQHHLSSSSSFQPILEEKLKIQDTCGVHNLHGMPGILGAIVGAVTAAVATVDIYGEG